MKKLLIITPIIVIILAIVFIVVLNIKPSATPDVPDKIEQIEKKQPVTVQPETEPEDDTELLDENDMPKSDVKVPEIG